MSLTPKQEKFCQCIVSGMSAKDSYINSYNTKGNEKTVYTEAMKIMSREDVQKRIGELRKPLENQAQTTALSERERIKDILWDRLDKAIEREDDATIVKITDQINRMNAEYINVNRNIDEASTDIKELDTDTLKKLSLVV
jgi:phage terminase small subunit